MDSMEINQNCRICLEQHALLDWNEEMLDFYGTTYKDCYYKYTHLDDHVTDPFSQMLCENCSTELRNAHFLIQKAIESYQVLQQTSASSLISTTKVENDTYKDHGDPSDFEIILFEQSTKSSIADDDNRIISMVDTSMETPKDLKKKHINKKSKVRKTKLEKHDDNFPEELEEYMNTLQSPLNISSLISQDEVEESSTKVKKKSRIMCIYCSKLIGAEHIKRHEDTHKEYRERTEMCTKCGIKLYNKTALYSHMLTHEENREKKYKCEYCDKAYFSRGGLTVHQRVHLGQMIPCTMCSKQFHRQVDLDRHNVKSHSASLLHTNFKYQPKYYVECKDCGKSIPSHRWRAHRDTHLKKFQMKCTLCDKHFVTKSSCHKHVNRVHKKPKEDYAKVVLYYGDNIDNRNSHLIINQTEKVVPILQQTKES